MPDSVPAKSQLLHRTAKRWGDVRRNHNTEERACDSQNTHTHLSVFVSPPQQSLQSIHSLKHYKDAVNGCHHPWLHHTTNSNSQSFSLINIIKTLHLCMSPPGGGTLSLVAPHRPFFLRIKRSTADRYHLQTG